MRTLLVLPILALAACANPNAPVGWGGYYEVIDANPKAVTVRYDDAVGGFRHAIKAAGAHCARNGGNAVPTNRTREFGQLFVHVFECR